MTSGSAKALRLIRSVLTSRFSVLPMFCYNTKLITSGPSLILLTFYPVLSTGLATGYGATTGRLRTTILIVLI